MKLTNAEKRALYIKIFVQEFIREFQFLSDVTAGRAQRKGEFTDKLLKLVESLSSAPMVGAAVSAISGAVSQAHEKRRSTQIGHIGKLSDQVNPHQLTILLNIVAREAVRRYEFFINTQLTDIPETGIIPFAKSGVERLLEYVARNGLSLSEDNLLDGFIKGRSGAYVSGFSNTKLVGKGAYEKSKLEAEGVYARSAFRTPDNQYWARETAKHKEEKWSSASALFESIYNYGYVVFKKGTKEPQYGYATVPYALVKQFDYQPHIPPYALEQELRAHSFHATQVDINFIENYLTQLQKSQATKRLVDYVAKQHPGTATVICREDLSRLSLKGGDFSDSDFSGAVISGDLTNTVFNNAYLIGARFSKISSMQGASFYNAHCEYLEAEEISFVGAALTQADFSYAKLKGATLTNCPALGVIWYGADLTKIKSDQDLLAEQKKQVTALQQAFAEQQKHLNQIEDSLAKQQAQIQTWSTKLDPLLDKLTQLEEKESLAQERTSELQNQVQQLLQEQMNRVTFERYCALELSQLHSRLNQTAQKSEVDLLKDNLQKMEAALADLKPQILPDFAAQLKVISQEQPALDEVCQALEQSLAGLRQEALQSAKDNEKRIDKLKNELDVLSQKLSVRIENLEQQYKQLGQTVTEVKASHIQLETKVDILASKQDAENPEKTLPIKLKKLQQQIVEDKETEAELATYIPVSGAFNINDATTFDLEKAVVKFFGSDKALLLVLGASGGGKSTFNRYLERKLWAQYQEGGPIPLMISLPLIQKPESDLIGEYLTRQGFTAKEIEVLKQQRSFYLILDAYDEMNKQINLYVSNQLNLWRAKILITCRTTYLTSINNYTKLFMPYHQEKPVPGLFTEMTVVPFSDSQIDAYIQKYLELHPDSPWQDVKTYRQHIAAIPGLRELIGTPFLLMIAMEVLPRIVAKYAHLEESERIKLTGANLYDEFVQLWFERQEDKLLMAGTLPEDGRDIKEDFREFSKQLAVAMHRADVTQVSYVPQSSLFGAKKADPWELFFGNSDSNMVRARKGAPLRKVGPNRHAFLHASLIPYFATTADYEDILDPVARPSEKVQVVSQPVVTSRPYTEVKQTAAHPADEKRTVPAATAHAVQQQGFFAPAAAPVTTTQQAAVVTVSVAQPVSVQQRPAKVQAVADPAPAAAPQAASGCCLVS